MILAIWTDWRCPNMAIAMFPPSSKSKGSSCKALRAKPVQPAKVSGETACMASGFGLVVRVTLPMEKIACNKLPKIEFLKLKVSRLGISEDEMAKELGLIGEIKNQFPKINKIMEIIKPAIVGVTAKSKRIRRWVAGIRDVFWLSCRLLRRPKPPMQGRKMGGANRTLYFAAM